MAFMYEVGGKNFDTDVQRVYITGNKLSDSLSIFVKKKLPTKQGCDGDRNAGLEVLVLEVDGDLCNGQDEEGGDVGGHQLVHWVPFQPDLGNEDFGKG